MLFWYLSHWRAANAQARLRMRAVLREPSLITHEKKGHI